MNTFTLPNFELKKRFEYSTGPISLKAMSLCCFRLVLDVFQDGKTCELQPSLVGPKGQGR